MILKHKLQIYTKKRLKLKALFLIAFIYLNFVNKKKNIVKSKLKMGHTKMKTLFTFFSINKISNIKINVHAYRQFFANRPLMY